MLRLGTIMIAAMLLAAVEAPASGHESEPPPPPKLEKPLVSGQDRGGITRAAKRRKRTSCCPTDLRAGPTPIARQQFVEFLDGMFGNAGQDVGEQSFHTRQHDRHGPCALWHPSSSYQKNQKVLSGDLSV